MITDLHEIVDTYYDTDDLALTAAGISLRRRTGGVDPGWRLTLPMKPGPVEVHEPLSRSAATVPKPLRMLVVAHTRNAALAPVEPEAGDRVPVAPEAVPLRPTRTRPASLVVQRRLRTQVEVMRRYDPLVRHDVPEAVHTMRVAVRRLRNALASYRLVLVREQTDAVRDELKWLAAALGEPRDAEVMRARLESMLADEPPEVVRGAGFERMDEEMGEQYSLARARMLRALNSDRYFALLDRLDDLSTDPPWRAKASEPVHAVLRKRVRQDYRRLAQRVEHAADAEDVEREHRLHEARKAAKRVRYAAEALTGVYGKPATRFVKAMKRVQSRLGDHHDASVTQERLRELGEESARTGDNAFVFGALHAREEQALLEADEQFVHEWSAASKKKLRRWLTS